MISQSHYSCWNIFKSDVFISRILTSIAVYIHTFNIIFLFSMQHFQANIKGMNDAYTREVHYRNKVYYSYLLLVVGVAEYI